MGLDVSTSKGSPLLRVDMFGGVKRGCSRTFAPASKQYTDSVYSHASIEDSRCHSVKRRELRREPKFPTYGFFVQLPAACIIFVGREYIELLYF